MRNRDTPIVGFLVGLGTLALGVLAVYFLLFRPSQGLSLGRFIQSFGFQPDLASKSLSLALITEIIPITWVKRRRLDNAARGLFVVIMLAAFAILWFKFVA